LAGSPAGGVAIVCDGRYVQEVRVCLDPISGRACRGDVRDRASPAPRRPTGALTGLILVTALALGAASLVHGADEGETLQSLAARDDVAGLARAINAGVPVDARDGEGRTALHVAAKEGFLFSAMMLISKGANPNARDAKRQTPLHLAAHGDLRREGERFQVVKLLVAKGSDRSALDVNGKRPVDLADVREFKDELAP
jgi:hypothetical protein